MEKTIAQLPAAGEQEREAIDAAATISPNLPPDEAFKSSAQLPHFLHRANINREECGDLKKFEDGVGEAIINREVHNNMLSVFLLADWLFTWAKDFFLKILDAPVESVESSGGTEWPISCQEWTLSTHAEDNFRTALKLFNERVRIFRTTESGLYGRARLPWDTDEPTFEMDLSSRFFDFFSSEFSMASSSTKNAVSICMAATIFHEMAHIFWYIRCHLELGQVEAVPDTPGRSRLYRPEPQILQPCPPSMLV